MSCNSNSCQLGAFMVHLLNLRWHATPTPTSANRRAKLWSTISPTYFARVNPRAYSEPTEHCRPPIDNAYPHSDFSLTQTDPGRRLLSCKAYANTGVSTSAHACAISEAQTFGRLCATKDGSAEVIALSRRKAGSIASSSLACCSFTSSRKSPA